MKKTKPKKKFDWLAFHKAKKNRNEAGRRSDNFSITQIRRISDRSPLNLGSNSSKTTPGIIGVRLEPSYQVLKNPCQKRKERRKALFSNGIAGKIKVHFAEWKKESYERC